MIRYPSVKTLTECSPHNDRAIALDVRKVLDGRTEVESTAIYGGARSHDKLCVADKLLHNHGVEWISWSCEDGDGAYPKGFHYSNAGDIYNATLVLYQGRFLVTTYGDMVERHERHCSACLKRSREEMHV